MTVYVGIDLHRKRSQVAVLSRLMGLGLLRADLLPEV